jgi:hypothetical protein
MQGLLADPAAACCVLLLLLLLLLLQELPSPPSPVEKRVTHCGYKVRYCMFCFLPLQTQELPAALSSLQQNLLRDLLLMTLSLHQLLLQLLLLRYPAAANISAL